MPHGFQALGLAQVDVGDGGVAKGKKADAKAAPKTDAKVRSDRLRPRHFLEWGFQAVGRD